MGLLEGAVGNSVWGAVWTAHRTMNIHKYTDTVVHWYRHCPMIIDIINDYPYSEAISHFPWDSYRHHCRYDCANSPLSHYLTASH